MKPVIVDLFKSVVDNTSTELGYSVYFHHGHMLEISNVVKQLSADPNVDHRYPLIALKHDITEHDVKYVGTEFSVTMYIITLSDPNYYAEDRKEKIFKPFLTPIMDEFFRQIADSGYFAEQTVDEVRDKCKHTNRLFWGRSDVMGNAANIFGDWVDCIELEFTNLTALNLGCEVVYDAPVLVHAFTDTKGYNVILRFNRNVKEPLLTDVTVSHNGTDMPVLSVTLSSDPSIVIAGVNILEWNKAVTVSISANVQSENGVNIIQLTDYPVVNNVIPDVQ